MKHSPWELWLSLAEERVTRADRRDVPSLSELSVCSGSVEKSESSVPSELLPAFLCNSTEPGISTGAWKRAFIDTVTYLVLGTYIEADTTTRTIILSGVFLWRK